MSDGRGFRIPCTISWMDIFAHIFDVKIVKMFV